MQPLPIPPRRIIARPPFETVWPIVRASALTAPWWSRLSLEAGRMMAYGARRSAYLTMSFFRPYPGKWTVTLVSSPLPSRRITVPTPHFS